MTVVVLFYSSFNSWNLARFPVSLISPFNWFQKKTIDAHHVQKISHLRLRLQQAHNSFHAALQPVREPDARESIHTALQPVREPDARESRVLPYMGNRGMCRPKGYGFWAFLVWNRVCFSLDLAWHWEICLPWNILLPHQLCSSGRLHPTNPFVWYPPPTPRIREVALTSIWDCDTLYFSVLIQTYHFSIFCFIFKCPIGRLPLRWWFVSF